MKKNIFRPIPVHSQLVSLIFYLLDRNDHLENYKTLNDLLKHYPIDELLENVFGEKYDFGFLCKEYQAYLRGEKNTLFVSPIKASRWCYVEVFDEDILIYTMFKKLKICTKRVFDWNYPDVIHPLGKKRGHSQSEVLHDFKSLPVPLFYSKYVYGATKQSPLKKPELRKDIALKIQNSYDEPFYDLKYYAISDSLGVGIDVRHISLFQMTQGNVLLDSIKFIADTWFYSDKQILRDLCFTPISKFGEKYKAVWLCPTDYRR